MILVSRSSNGGRERSGRLALVRYGYLATMRARPGRRDDIVALLLGGVDGLRAAGCDLYVVGTPAGTPGGGTGDPDVIWVYEVWRSREHHAASLELPATKAAIAAAMPMLTGEFTGQALAVAGGLGVPD